MYNFKVGEIVYFFESYEALYYQKVDNYVHKIVHIFPPGKPYEIIHYNSVTCTLLDLVTQKKYLIFSDYHLIPLEVYRDLKIKQIVGVDD